MIMSETRLLHALAIPKQLAQVRKRQMKPFTNRSLLRVLSALCFLILCAFGLPLRAQDTPKITVATVNLSLIHISEPTRPY